MFFVDSTYRDSGGQISDIAVLRRARFIRVLAPNPAWALPFVPSIPYLYPQIILHRDYLSLQGGLMILAFVLVIIYFPDKPKYAPTASAVTARLNVKQVGAVTC